MSIREVVIPQTVGGKIETAGTATTGVSALLSYLSIAEIASLVTLVMGIIVFIIGRIYSIQDRKRLEIEHQKKMELMQLQIDREQAELDRIRGVACDVQ